MLVLRAILTIAIAFSIQNTTLAEKEEKKAGSSPTPKEQKVERQTKEQKVERRSVYARVESAVGKGVGIRADKVPGDFTIPESMTARNFKYKFHDPKGKIKLDKLTESSIYSITEKRYVSEAVNSADFELPPGKYKFLVGGRPGAYGSLSFDVAPGDSVSVVIKDDVPEADLPDDGTISVLLWCPETPMHKLHWTFEIEAGVITGRGVATNTNTSHVQNYQARYHFKGNLAANGIEGTHSYNITWEAALRNGGTQKHVCEGEGSMRIRLRTDHTVIGAETITGTTNGVQTLNDKEVRLVGKWSKGNR